jgi:hypothetical protein
MENITKANFNDDIFITPHAVEKARELFGFESEQDARRFIINNLKQSIFVSEIVGESGKVDRLFAHRRVAFIMDRIDDVVITIYIRENVDADLRAKVRDLLCDHLKELEKQEQQLALNILEADIDAELTRSLAAIGIDELDKWTEIADNTLEIARESLRDFQLEKSKVAKGIVAFL